MSAADHAFVKAIYTIKALSRGPSALERPSEDRRIELYGLYKQATEGDIEGLLPRPEGSTLQGLASRKKWDAWKAQEGVSEHEAKTRYVGLLLETMQQLNPETFSQQPAWRDLKSAYLQALQPQRVPTYSEFGLSERQSDIEDPADTVSNWRHDVSWQLESITEELRNRERNTPHPSGDEKNKWLLLIRHILVNTYGLVQRVITDLAFILFVLLVIRIVRSKIVRAPKLIRHIPVAVVRMLIDTVKDFGFHFQSA